MFRISYLVEDQDLVKAINMIAPIAIGLSVNQAPNGQASLIPINTLRRTQSLDLLMQALNRHKLKSFKMSKFREITKEAGLNPASANYYMQQLIKNGCLSMLGRKGINVTYQVAEA